MRQPAFLLQAGAPLIIQCALVREQPFLPARQKDRLELQPLGGMQRHDRHRLAAFALLRVHHQRNVLEEAREVLELVHGADKLFQVLQAAGGVCVAVLLPHVRIAGLVEHDLRELGMGQRIPLGAPALERGEQIAQRPAGLGLELVGLDHRSGGGRERDAPLARVIVQDLHRGVAEAAPRHVDDALEGEIVAGGVDDAEIGQRVADLLALVEARAANDPIRQTEGDEAVLELAHLERGAHEDRHLVERMRLAVAVVALELLDLLAHAARLLLRIPAGGHLHLVPRLVLGAQRLAEPALVVGDEMRGGGENVRGRAVIAFEANDLGAGKVVLEPQDVVHLRAAPAVDRLIVVPYAADVFQLRRCDVSRSVQQARTLSPCGRGCRAAGAQRRRRGG